MSKAIVLDSNLLLLYVIGSASRSLIATHKGIRAFSVEDFDLLAKMLSDAATIIVTPNTVTETSNLLDRIKNSKHRNRANNVLKRLLEFVGERYVPSTTAFNRPECRFLGVTDCIMLELALQGATLLTSDLDLFIAATRNKYLAINFNHYRDNNRYGS